MAVGAVATDINKGVWENPQALKDLDAGIPLHRMGTADEIASVARSLLDPENSYMTGNTVTVDGGLLLTRGYGCPKPYGE
jgi:NAD(P)-dependent dehydrogenase (short-subunit alcohol dehydrogenase family)